MKIVENLTLFNLNKKGRRKNVWKSWKNWLKIALGAVFAFYVLFLLPEKPKKSETTAEITIKTAKK